MLQITFRHTESSESLRALAEEKLEKLSPHFTTAPRCQLVIDTAPGHSRKGGAFSAHVELSLGEEHLHIGGQAEREHAACAVREAFAHVERQLHARGQRRSG